MSCVYDASALLAALLEEPGADVVRARLPGGLAVSVNLAEVIERLALDFEDASAAAAVSALPLATVPPGMEIARRAAELRALTRVAGLSLGDRFCLALASLSGLPALTADRNWAAVAEAAGVEVILIR